MEAVARNLVDNPNDLKFTPIDSSVGGMLIGLACTLAMLEDGRVAGISGLYGEFLRTFTDGRGDYWALAFVLGLSGAGVVNLIFNKDFALPGPLHENAVIYLIVGAMSGIGTTLGCGCTSGHGIVGLSRLSFRSFVAVCVFMAAGFLTVNLLRVISHDAGKPTLASYEPPQLWTGIAFGLGISISVSAYLLHKVVAVIVPLACGLVFGIGLGAAGMTNQHKVIGFLNLSGLWDPSLAFVMGGALAVGVPCFAVMRSSLSKPLRAERWDTVGPFAPGKPVDRDFILGNILFGISWGLLGICPGPALFATLPYWLSGFSSSSGWYFLLWSAAAGLSRTLIVELRRHRNHDK